MVIDVEVSVSGSSNLVTDSTCTLIHETLTNITYMRTKGQIISKKKYVVLDSSKKRTLGQFYVLKNAPAFVFWKNPGRHNLLLRFTDL
jgi:hypothetical protein